MRTRKRFLRLVLAGTLAAALMAGCGDDDDKNASNNPPDEGGSTQTPLYAVINVPDTTGGAPQMSYVTLTESLTGDLGPANAVLEIPGFAIGGSPRGSKRLYLGNGTSGIITRYELDGDSLTESGQVDLGAQGVTAINGYPSAFQFIDDDKAYFISRTGDIAIWNPEELVVTGKISMPELIREIPDSPGTNYTMALTGAPLRHEDKLYVFASWDTRSGGVVKIPGAYALAIVDTDTDTAEVFVDEAGCGYGRDGVLVGDWLYIATEAVGASVHFLNPDNGPTPCLRRFNIRTKTFDPDYTIDLNALTGGPTGSLVTTAAGEALIHVLDTESPLIAGVTNPRVLSSTAVWKTARLTVGDEPSIEILDVPLRTASVIPVTLGDDLRVTATFDENPRIVEVTRDGIVPTERTGGTVAGTVWTILELR